MMFIFALLSFTACDDASDMRRKADDAQSEANTKIDAVAAKADQEIRVVQAEADKKIAAEVASFTTLREEYRHKVSLNLVELDKKVADLEARAKTANGKDKIEREAKLVTIYAHRETFMTDFKTLETESAATWDATQARLDAEWADLVAQVTG